VKQMLMTTIAREWFCSPGLISALD
jgi:hypothetical protein